MKTLIFNGSPRKHGGSSDVIEAVCRKLESAGSEYYIVNAYYSNVKPCIDCRYCWTHEGCCVNDEMQKVFAYLEECDNVLLVSPIYFMELTGPLLSVLSRMQVYFSARIFQKKQLLKKEKRGAVVLVAGSKKDSFDRAYQTAKVCLHEMQVTEILPVMGFHETDCIAVTEQESFPQVTDDVVSFFSRGNAE